MKLQRVLAAIAVVFTLSAVGLFAAEGSKPAGLSNPIIEEPKVDDPVDVAPFGEMRTWEDGKDIGILWEDSRDIFKVVVVFADANSMPDPAKVKLQYWRSTWPQQRAPRDKLVGSGGSGWLNVGDWFQGEWKDADVKVSADGVAWTYTFKPINETEFPDQKDFSAEYRSTLKLRLLFPERAPAMSAFQTFTDSIWKEGGALVEWGGNEETPVPYDGHAEIYNGHIKKVSILMGSKMKMVDDISWAGTADKVWTAGIVINYLYVKPAVVNSFDDTIITIRTARHNFSFLGKGFKGHLMFPDPEYQRIYIRDIGVLIRGFRDGSTYGDVEKAYSNAVKCLYQKVGEMPEQTLNRAWNDMPKKGSRIYMPLAVEGGRQHFRLLGDGNVQLDTNWQRRAPADDTKRIDRGANMYVSFEIPREGAKSGASLAEGVLPIATTWYEKSGVLYSEEAFATTYSGKLPKGGRIPATEPIALMMRFRFTNKTAGPRTVNMPIWIDTGEKDFLREDNGLVYGALEESAKDRGKFRLYINANKAAKLTVKGTQLNCEVVLQPKASRDIYITIPFETPSGAEVARIKALAYDAQRKMIADYWRKRIAQGCVISTPDKMVNEFYAANATHQLINTDNEPGTNERAMANVGTFGYGVYANESIMMVSELDRRGYHDVAAKALETWLHYQGTAGLPGDYTTKDGVLYGAKGHESGGYNQHHGWVLWGMAEHYWFTGDKAWLKQVAPKLVKACDWITGQRKRTMTDECVGIRAIEYGLLPPGSLEDIGDWRSWLSNNVFSWWGMNNVANALADIKHPQAKRLQAEAKAYREDIRKAFFEAMIRTPVVALRDGTFVPTIPSDVHRRGRSFGWITETLEGSIHLIRCGIISPDEPAAKWIMQDYEDNRYISDQFGYQIKENFDKLWFSLGGFSQQPSLLCSPTPYLQRDQPKHYLRAYFNAFAAGYFPERAMLTEHPLPNLGDYRGDHFKSSDEAMNTSWIRWMFVWDEGKDLYLGKMMPRYWLADGKTVSIVRAATHFGDMSMTMRSFTAKGRIEMTIDPPKRKAPGAIYARFRHPQAKPIKKVTVNGKPWSKFNTAKEWVVLPALKAKTVVVAYY